MRKFRLPTRMADGGMAGAPQFTPTWQQPSNQGGNQGGMVNPADFAYARAAAPSVPQSMAPQAAPMPGQSPSDLMQAQRQLDPRMVQGSGFMPQKRSWKDYAGSLIDSAVLGAAAGAGGPLAGGATAGIVTAIKEILKAKKPKASTVVKSKKGGLVKKANCGPMKKAKGGPVKKKKGC